jgi:hypothetical protein
MAVAAFSVEEVVSSFAPEACVAFAAGYYFVGVRATDRAACD